MKYIVPSRFFRAESVGKEANNDHADRVKPLHIAEGERGDTRVYAEVDGEWDIMRRI